MGENLFQPGILRRDIKIIDGDPPMLFDPQADSYYRLPENTLKIVDLLDREQSFDTLLQRIHRYYPGFDAGELNKLLIFLRRNGLFEPAYGEAGARHRMISQLKSESKLVRWASAYLFFRLPPWRPEKFFRRIAPCVSFLAAKKFLTILMIPAALGYILAIQHLSEVRDAFVNTLVWAGLVKYFAVICLVKVIHEAAHSLAAIHFNCRVRGIGIGFMLFYPRLYTDTTDSYRLSRRRRLLIDSAGMIAEVLLGGIAALLWVLLLPGAARSTMFYLFAVSTVSTLLINGNALIRYDGYYILCDLLRVDNLMQRSSEQLKALFHYILLKPAPVPPKAHALLFTVYGFASFLYRITLYTSIIMVIYYKFTKVIAVLLLLLEIWVIVFVPLCRAIVRIAAVKKEYHARLRRLPLAIITAGIAGILFLPLSWEAELPGITVPREEHLITAAESGFLTAPLAKSPRPVRCGEVLFTLTSHKMAMAQKRLDAELEHDETLLNLQNLDEKELSGSKITAEKVISDRLALQELKRRNKNLTHTAPAEGFFVSALPELSAGAYLQRTLPVGRIISKNNKIFAYATETQIGNLTIGSRDKVKFPDDLQTYSAKVTAIEKLPRYLHDSPLLQYYGGTIPYFPAAEKSGSFHSQEPYYQVEIQFTGKVPELLAGRSVQISVINRTPLGKRLLNMAIGAFRREF